MEWWCAVGEMGATSAVSPARSLGRRRQANVAGGRPRKHEVKVSPAEAEALAEIAQTQGVSVPRLLVEAALSGTGETSAQRREAMVELFAVHRKLAAISNNVNQMAKAANATHEMPEEMAATLAAVKATAFRIDDVLKAIGAQERRYNRR